MIYVTPTPRSNTVNVAEQSVPRKHTDAGPSNSRRRQRTSSAGADAKDDDFWQGTDADTVRMRAMYLKLKEDLKEDLSAEWWEETRRLRAEFRQMEAEMKVWLQQRIKSCTDEIHEIRRSNVQMEDHVNDEIQGGEG